MSGPRKSGTTPGALDQRAGDLPGPGVAERDVRAAARRVARGRELEPERREPRVVQRDDPLGQRDRLRVQRGDAGLGGEPHPSSTAARPRIGGVPARKRRIDGLGVVVALHRELVALAEPALDRRAQPVLERGGDVEVGGRARAGVEVLVGAADRQLGARSRAARPAPRRPSGSGPRSASRPRSRAAAWSAGRSASAPRAVVDVGEHDDVAAPARAASRRRARRRTAAAPARAARRSPRARSGRSGSCRGR